MKFDLSKLQTRILTNDEIEAMEGASTDSLVAIQWLKEQFWVSDENNPEEKRMIQPGEGVEIAGFESRNAAKNFNNYYTSKAVTELKWGESDPGKIRSRGQVRERDGKFYLWIKRIR